MKLTDRRRKVLVLGGDDIRPVIGVVRSLGRAGFDVHTAWMSGDASLVTHSRYVHSHHKLPLYDPDSTHWKMTLIELLQRERFDLVIPCSDLSIIPLQVHRSEFEPIVKLAILDSPTYAIVTDKLAVNDRARGAGVRVPRELVLTPNTDFAELRNEFLLPIVLKPQSSFNLNSVGSRHVVRKIDHWDELESTVANMQQEGNVSVQEYRTGRGVGVEMLLLDGSPLMEFQHVRLHEPIHGGGSFYRTGVAISPELREAALAILTPLRYTGVAMVEFKVDPRTGEWVFIEVNPRFWGSLPLAVASGADFPLALTLMLLDGRTDFPAIPRRKLACRHLTGDLYWQIANLRADRTDRTLISVPPIAVIRETIVNVLLLRERSDTLTLDDPRPGIRELSDLAKTLIAGVRRRIRRICFQRRAVRARMHARAIQAAMAAETILVVCKGNICRSPFAHVAWNRSRRPGQRIVSAGYYPKSGRPTPAAGIDAAEQLGYDLATHRSVPLTQALIDQADAVFVFDLENYERLVAEYRSRHKLHFLGALRPAGRLWIDDPYGGTTQTFVDTYRTIVDCLNQIADGVPATVPDRNIDASSV